MTLPIDFEAHPLVPAVIQDDATRDVLMVGFMNQLAYEKTQETGFVHFWSRSRNQLWMKGATSGHTQEVVSLAVNCEDNSLLIQVIQKGAVCHTGHTTCYYRQILPDGALFETSDPVFDPAEIYQHPAEIARRKRGGAQIEDSSRYIGIWYGAYEYLKRQPLQKVSGTSKLLHDAQLFPSDRIADELEELAGVLAGEHAHSGDLVQDVILEGSQVFYWLNLFGVRFAREWDTELKLDQVITTPRDRATDREQEVHTLRKDAARWRDARRRFDVEQGDFIEELLEAHVSTYRDVANAVAGVVEPRRLVDYDLESLRTRPYLADYFSSADG